MRTDSLKSAIATQFKPGFDITFEELYEHVGLRRLDSVFLEFLRHIIRLLEFISIN